MRFRASSRESCCWAFPNYAYDWTLPYEAGLTRAVVIGNEAARQLAFDTRSEIQFDETAQTPWFSLHGHGRRGT